VEKKGLNRGLAPEISELKTTTKENAPEKIENWGENPLEEDDNHRRKRNHQERLQGENFVRPWRYRSVEKQGSWSRARQRKKSNSGQTKVGKPRKKNPGIRGRFDSPGGLKLSSMREEKKLPAWEERETRKKRKTTLSKGSVREKEMGKKKK